MQVLLRKSDTKQDIKCATCGQAFRVYWQPATQAERNTMRAIVTGELKLQHEMDKTAAAHPANAFSLPGWGCASPEYASSSLIGGGHSGARPSAVRNGTYR
jgi:hypothetical protein